jgi:two-component system sensor histidine kinase BaeS
MWHALVPVGVLMSINGLHLYRRVAAGESITIELILTVLGFLILGRLLLIVAEDRRLVEEDRKTLISIVSHELRTPLTAVDGYLDIVLGDWNGLADDDKRQMIAIAHEQARLVTRIVTDLVETSRDKLHSTKLRLELVDVGELMRQVIGQLEGGSRFQHLEPDCLVAGDRIRMTQILTNLFSNAERYGQDEQIVGVVRHDGTEIEIAVHDGGPGVPRQHRERIWEAFERGNHRFDASIPGSGLGLAIVRSLVDAHGGTAGYRESEILGGACFWVRLAGIPVEILQSRPVPALLLS